MRRSGFVPLAIGAMFAFASPALAGAPDTTITSGPSGLIAKTTAAFKFKATVSGATFQCKIDAKDWATCDSPKKYKKLSQGEHAFRVRARKGHATDKTPATRGFRVDTVPPDTTVYGPQDNLATYVNGYTEDQTPDSTFESNEPATFECRITSASSTPAFEPCGTPFTPASPLPRDAFYTIEARAIDEAGNVDPTPGSWDFSVETPITEDQQTADAAAAIYFPNSGTRDVPAECSGSTHIDCPGGSAASPDDDQLSTTSSRTVVPGPLNSHRYDLTVNPHGAQTLSPVVLTISGTDCNLTFNSATAPTDHWTITESLNFATGAYTNTFFPGGKAIEPQNTSVSGIDSGDYSLSGINPLCSISNFYPASQLASAYPEMVGAYDPLCAKLGPGYLGPCPTGP